MQGVQSREAPDKEPRRADLAIVDGPPIFEEEDEPRDDPEDLDRKVAVMVSRRQQQDEDGPQRMAIARHERLGIWRQETVMINKHNQRAREP